MESGVCTISMRRTYFGQEEELAVGISLAYPISDTPTRITEIVEGQVAAMRDALEEASLRALNSEYPLVSNDATIEPDTETGVLFEPETEPEDAPNIDVVFDQSDDEEFPDDEPVDPEDSTGFETSSADIPDDPQPAPEDQPAERPSDPPPVVSDLPLNRPKQIVLAAECKRVGIEHDAMTVLLVDLFRKPSLAMLTKTEGETLMQRLKDGSITSFVAVRHMPGGDG